MKLSKVIVVALAVAVCGSAQAQGFLKKAKAAAEKATKVVENVTGTATGDEAKADETKIDWDKVPVYTAKQYTLTDDNGVALTNEDGTPQVRVFLEDQFGRRRSAESVKAQNDRLKKHIGAIVAKVGGGAALGAATGMLSGKGAKGAAAGAAAGVAAGALASIDDIKKAKAQHKSLKEQEKLIKAYSTTFTAEGTPVDAKADLSKVKDLTIDSAADLTLSAAALKDELASDAFNTTDDDWNIPATPAEGEKDA